jgi:hypothetical protein
MKHPNCHEDKDSKGEDMSQGSQVQPHSFYFVEIYITVSCIFWDGKGIKRNWNTCRCCRSPPCRFSCIRFQDCFLRMDSCVDHTWSEC